MIEVVVCVPDGVDPAPECRAALPEARVVHAPRIWQARRLALESSDADVIAFVDGDVVVPPGWSERLAAAWEQAGWQIAAIGGPVAGGGDPGVAAELDWGTEPLDVDPLERTLLGGNLSFRRRALVGAGGFGATVDRRDARDWLSEEHEAQRQLGHWGWLIRYDPALRAERRGGWRAAPGGGRYRHGVRVGVARGRKAGDALRALASASAGTLAATGMRRGELARDRGRRAAENAGVLTAPIAAPRAWRRRGQWPLRASTRPAARGRPPLVLLYHRIAAGAPDPLGLCISPDNFSQQLEVLADELRIVSMDELVAERPPDAVAITFDDGYADNLEPLRAAGVPITLFVATGHVAAARPFFWDEAARLLAARTNVPLTLTIEGRPHEWRPARDRTAVLRELHRLLQPQRAEVIDDALEQLQRWAGAAAPPPDEATRLMTVDELRSLSAAGIDVGAHTRRHVNLAHQDDVVVREEIAGSRDDVADWTGARPRGLSYPFGIPRHDVSDAARRAAADAGFDYAVVNQPIAVTGDADRFAIPRLFAPDLPGDSFREHLRRAG